MPPMSKHMQRAPAAADTDSVEVERRIEQRIADQARLRATA